MDYEKLAVLVVEDDMAMCTYVINLLGRLGIQNIHHCKDGDEALKQISHSKPDLILSDIHMMPINGFDFVDQLRHSRTHGHRNIPVIFMSSDISNQTLTTASTLQSVAYIIKPPRLELLKKKIELAMKVI